MLSDGSRLYHGSPGRPWAATEPGEDGEWDDDAFVTDDVFGALRAVDELRAVGADQVRGVEVVHDQGSVPDTGEVFEVWVDAAGRIMRLREVASPTPARPRGTAVSENGRGVTSSGGMWRLPMTVELWDFGVAVDIVPPPDAVPAPAD